MNRRMIVPPEQMNQHRYAGVDPIQPFSYARQQPTPPKKHIQHDTDVLVDLENKNQLFDSFFFAFLIELHILVHFKCLKDGFRIVKKRSLLLSHSHHHHQQIVPRVNI